MSAMLIILLSACGISQSKYAKISDYVIQNKDEISHNGKEEFFIHDGTGLPTAGVYYGYYYTVDNEPAIPTEDNEGVAWDYTVEDAFYQGDEGFYWGKPNNGTDWYYTRKITDNWYYYEVHCG